MRRTWERVVQPITLHEALELREELGETARVVAGGTDVVVELSRGVKPTSTLLDLSHVAELRGISTTPDTIVLGALATHNDVLASPDCQEFALPLVQACLEIGAPQLRARATVVGNIVTGSPANDTISALLALDAQVELASIADRRVVPIGDFHVGFRQTVLGPDELVVAIHVPRMRANQRGWYTKLGLRRAQAISVIHLAVVLEFDSAAIVSARVAYGCLAPTVVRGIATEAALTGQPLTNRTIERAVAAAQNDVSPIDDIRGSAGYRRSVLERLLSDTLETLASGRGPSTAISAPILLESNTTYPHSSDMATEAETVDLTINGEPVSWPASLAGLTLLDALRHQGLTGTKEGCAEGECGSCTVWVDGRAVMSCLVPAAQVRGSQVTTIEGLAGQDESSAGLHPLQQAFIDHGAVQCGFCIPGMLMAGAMLLRERDIPADDEVQRALSGNLCRCTGYRKILAAVGDVAGGSR